MVDLPETAASWASSQRRRSSTRGFVRRCRAWRPIDQAVRRRDDGTGAERLDVIPAQFKVIVTRRPKYACQVCAGEVVQAPALERLIENGIPTETLVAHVLVAKYADHTPLYRQAQIYARQ